MKDSKNIIERFLWTGLGSALSLFFRIFWEKQAKFHESEEIFDQMSHIRSLSVLPVLRKVCNRQKDSTNTIVHVYPSFFPFDWKCTKIKWTKLFLDMIFPKWTTIQHHQPFNPTRILIQYTIRNNNSWTWTERTTW